MTRTLQSDWQVNYVLEGCQLGSYTRVCWFWYTHTHTQTDRHTHTCNTDWKVMLCFSSRATKNPHSVKKIAVKMANNNSSLSSGSFCQSCPVWRDLIFHCVREMLGIFKETVKRHNMSHLVYLQRFSLVETNISSEILIKICWKTIVPNVNEYDYYYQLCSKIVNKSVRKRNHNYTVIVCCIAVVKFYH